MSKEKIQKIISDYPKHYSAMIQRDPELTQWVRANSTASGDFARLIYSAVSGTNGVCAQGNAQRFKNIHNGWGFCGPARSCDCAKRSVSEKVQAAMAGLDQKKIAAKRKFTALERYGVDNVGKTSQAQRNHQQFYKNADQVQQLTANIKNTLQQRYGVSNPRHISGVEDRIKSTNLARYGVSNPMQSPDVQKQAQATRQARYHHRYLLENSYTRMLEKYKSFGYELLCTQDQYNGIAQYYHFRHQECGHEFETYINNGKNPVCPACYYTAPAYVSGAETQLADWISGSGVRVIRQERSLIRPYHLDIFIPDHNLAVEYCGLYWHSERGNGKSQNYHLNKLERCTQAGVQLITIFEDEWLQKNAIVKSILSNRLGLSQSIGARKCRVVQLSNAQAKQFFEDNHLLGHVNASEIFGLEYQGQIIFAMSFGRSRYNKKYHWELLRMCNALGFRTIGGAQRCLHASGKTNIISYADRRWFTGCTYQNLGMRELQATGPGYWYTDYKQRYHRGGFTKQKLIKQGYDSNLTEAAIMQSLGYDRIWDCGNRVFVLE